MKIKHQAEWDAWYSVNQTDAYSRGTVNYAIRWAELMEREIANGKTVLDVAKQTKREADIDNISGYMFGIAATALMQWWEYGDELRAVYER